MAPVLLTVNGEAREVAARHVAELVEALGLPGPALLIEHNGLALRREEWSQREIRSGDSLEIIRVVAGG